MTLKLVHCYDDRLSPIMWFYFVLYILYIYSCCIVYHTISYYDRTYQIRSYYIIYDLFLS